MAREPLDGQFIEVQRLLERPSPAFSNEQMFEADPRLFPALRDALKILVLGAGGLGCELLKDLALLGFKNLHVIDMDTIDLSNLNRQFLFRHSDIGKAKAQVAADFVNKRVPTCKVTAHFNRIEEFGTDFYESFHVIVCGLDSITARRWIQQMLLSLLKYDKEGKVDSGSIKPLIDGGTEGFKGSVRTIYPGMSACIECTLDLYPPQVNFPLCTIAHTPRLPEHCVEWAKIMAWPEEEPFGAGVEVDGDDPNHVTWIMKKAQERASNYGIKNVSYRLTQGVIKHIIPAVASTNASIAGLCAMEVLKVASNCSLGLNNWLNFNNTHAVYTFSYEQERNEECISCSRKVKKIELKTDATLHHLLTYLNEEPSLKMTEPSIVLSFGGDNVKTLWMPGSKFLQQKLQDNLNKKLSELQVVNGSVLEVQDKTSPLGLTFNVNFVD